MRELVAITREVIQAFGAAEQRPWTIEAAMIELGYLGRPVTF